MLFPPGEGPRTGVRLTPAEDGLPFLDWTGVVDGGVEDDGIPADPRVSMRLLGEHTHAFFGRPHLRGHRGGQDWTTRFVSTDLVVEPSVLRLSASDESAGLALTYEIESLDGGGLRARAEVTNRAEAAYAVEGLEVVLPVPDHLTEVLDFTGRHERERTPQRHQVTDGLYLREARGGRPGLDSASFLAVGTPGFTGTSGEVVAVHVGWSGNSVLRLERHAATMTTIGGGELLLAGEVVLEKNESYASPWLYVGASDAGLDDISASWHAWQRSLPSHPPWQPVVLNVWEAVFFDHELTRLKGIADRAARVGVERFVLDDGWFRHRRDDHSGLGDWYVDETVWPDGLGPLIDHVTGLGMEFGLWFEPEMVNPDSDLFREHPEWTLSAPGRLPNQERFQQVLDLSLSAVRDHLFERIDAVLSTYPIRFVKWDHNRELLEAGSPARGHRPSVREQTLGFYDLLERLRAAHPDIAWESCSSGGGRIDFGVLPLVQRFWASDMTDALARQQIQRSTARLIAPELMGAHVSSPHSHTTGRTLGLDFRCATALFGAFGIEWDLTAADEGDLERLAAWVALHQQWRPLLHGGRVVTPESADPAVLLHGVVALDRSQALVAHVQMDESSHSRGVSVRVPGLDPAATYAAAWVGPIDRGAVSRSVALHADGPLAGTTMSGAGLGSRGFHVPRRRPETISLALLQRVD